ncbi:hypothetical protein Fmac_015419 [Flemingia macrophylla]|uniref:Uncharacterized protein n=1 Tax=Flemingia macrophylla TaxID=520843 RepID=A0ABD1MEJ8_9FABA
MNLPPRQAPRSRRRMLYPRGPHNWPCVRNIARVPGDDVHPGLAPLLPQPIGGADVGEEERRLVALQRLIHVKADGDALSPVLPSYCFRRTLSDSRNDSPWLSSVAELDRRPPRSEEVSRSLLLRRSR